MTIFVFSQTVMESEEAVAHRLMQEPGTNHWKPTSYLQCGILFLEYSLIVDFNVYIVRLCMTHVTLYGELECLYTL